MTPDEAKRLELFIQDHDTRSVPTAVEQDNASHVLLKMSDGQEITIHTVTEYQEKFIDSADPGPTIKAAWQKWGP